VEQFLVKLGLRIDDIDDGRQEFLLQLTFPPLPIELPFLGQPEIALQLQPVLEELLERLDESIISPTTCAS